MNIYNYCLIRLLISPIFPTLLGFILCMLLKSFESAYFCLCDGETLD